MSSSSKYTQWCMLLHVRNTGGIPILYLILDWLDLAFYLKKSYIRTHKLLIISQESEPLYQSVTGRHRKAFSRVRSCLTECWIELNLLMKQIWYKIGKTWLSRYRRWQENLWITCQNGKIQSEKKVLLSSYWRLTIFEERWANLLNVT